MPVFKAIKGLLPELEAHPGKPFQCQKPWAAARRAVNNELMLEGDWRRRALDSPGHGRVECQPVVLHNTETGELRLFYGCKVRRADAAGSPWKHEAIVKFVAAASTVEELTEHLR